MPGRTAPASALQFHQHPETLQQQLSRLDPDLNFYRACFHHELNDFFVGQIMRATEGKANPALLNELLRKKLTGDSGGAS